MKPNKDSDDYRYILSLEQQKLKRQSLATKQQRFTNRKADLLKLVNEYNNLERRIRDEYAVVTALEQIYEEPKVKAYQKQVREREKLTLQQQRERELAQVNARYQQMMVNNNPQMMVNNNNNHQLVLAHPRVNIEEIDD